MTSRAKILLSLVIAAAVLVAAAAYVATKLRPAIASAVEQYGEAATGTDVHVGSVAVSLGDSRAALNDLVVDNPPGFATDYALRIGEVAVRVDVPSLARGTIVLPEVTLTEATLNAEQRGAASNLTELLEHMNGGERDAGGERGAEAESSGETGQKIIIDRFRLVEGRIAVTSDALSEPESIDLPEVVVNGIGRAEGGVTFSEATQQLLSPILSAARDAVRERLGTAVEDAAKRKLEDAARRRLEELTRRKE